MADTPTKPGPNLGRASAILASGTTVSRVLGFVKAFVLIQTIGSLGFDVANESRILFNKLQDRFLNGTFRFGSKIPWVFCQAGLFN